MTGRQQAVALLHHTDIQFAFYGKADLIEVSFGIGRPQPMVVQAFLQRR